MTIEHLKSLPESGLGSSLMGDEATFSAWGRIPGDILTAIRVEKDDRSEDGRWRVA